MKIIHWFQTLFANYIRHDHSRYAAAIAFYTIFSLAPMLMMGVTIVSWKFNSQEAQEEIFKYVGKTLGRDSEAAIRTIAEKIGLDQIQLDRTDIWASLLGLFILLMGASKVITELHDAVNNIFDIQEEKFSRKLWIRIRARIVSMTLVICFGLLLVASLFLDTLMLTLGELVESKLGLTINFLYIAEKMISFLFIPLLHGIYLKVLPSRPVPFRHLWLGTLVSTLLFYVGKYSMSLYISYNGITSTYGAAGSIIILLIWIYFSIQVLLIGAEICAMSLAKHDKKL